MYASNLFKQINKIIDDTVKVNITSPFQATAPFLLKQAQSPNNVGNARNFGTTPAAKLASAEESDEQQEATTPNTRQPTIFPYDNWSRLRSNYSGYDPNKPIDDPLLDDKIPPRPEEAFKEPFAIRQLFSHYNTGLPPYHDYVIANSLTPLNTAGRSIIEDTKRPLSHSYSDMYTDYYVNNLVKTPAINPVYGLSSRDAFINTLNQAEEDYKRAKDNYLKVLKSNATSEDIKRAQAAFDNAENRYGYLLHSYYNLLNRPFGHNYIREDDLEGKPFRVFSESDLRLDNHPAAAKARNLLQQAPYVKYILAERMAEFHKDLIDLRNRHLLAGEPIDPNDYATRVNAILHSNVFARDMDKFDFMEAPLPENATKEELENYNRLLNESKRFLDSFSLKSNNQPEPENEYRSFSTRPTTNDISYSYTPEFVPYRVDRIAPAEDAVILNSFDLYGDPVFKPIRIPTSEDGNKAPTEIQIRPQVHRELPLLIEQGTGSQQQDKTFVRNKAGDIIHDSLSDPTTSSLIQLSLMARAGLLRNDELYAIPIGGKPNTPLYIKVQYTEPTAGYGSERVSTGPPSLQPLTFVTKDGRKMPKLYALSLVFVPTTIGIVPTDQEIPISESSIENLNEFQNKLSTVLVDVNTPTMVNHLSSVVQKLLRRHGSYDKDRVDEYISNILKNYKKEISNYKDVADFIHFALKDPNFPGDENVKNAVWAEFAPPGRILFDPNADKLYLNIGKIPESH